MLSPNTQAVQTPDQETQAEKTFSGWPIALRAMPLPYVPGVLLTRTDKGGCPLPDCAGQFSPGLSGEASVSLRLCRKQDPEFLPLRRGAAGSDPERANRGP